MKSKGQIEVVILFLILIGIILFTKFSKPQKETEEPGPVPKSVFEKETTISSPVEKLPVEEPPIVQLLPPPDATSPFRSNPAPTKDLPVETRKTMISLETDEKAICRYGDVSGLSYDSMRNIFSDTNAFSHSTLVTGLSEGGEYKYYVKCADEHSNKNNDDFIISFKVKLPEDLTPPERRNLEPIATLPAGTTKTIISVSTNEPASCRYSFTQGNDYRSMKYSFSANKTKTWHTANVKDLGNGMAYEYFVRCKDLAGNVNMGDAMISFSVADK